MPYESKAQAAYMHIHHPEITAKWKEEGHGYVKAKKRNGKMKKLQHVEKSKREWAAGLGVATAGGALANQVPPIQEVARKRKKKGKVAKADYESLVHTDDPEFNHQAARKIFDLVMKMDTDTAEMFTLMAAGEIYETTVEKNLHTLQRHLNQVISKRLADTKRAMLRTVAKGHHDGALEAAEALGQIEEIIKVGAAQRYGYDWEETDFRRDPGSGRFQAKVKHTQKKPLSNRVADGMGLLPTEPAQRNKYARLTPAQKAQFQDEYRQLGQFLSMITESTADGGDRDVWLRLKDKQGNEYRQKHTGGPEFANEVLLNPNRTLLQVEATPTTLTAGGAAFGLANALGAQPGPGTAGRLGMGNRAVEGLPDFRTSWTAAPPDMRGSNDRLYNRTAAAGAYVGQIAPPGSKAGMAAQMAQIVGSHGPEAEAVIGPTARKTAYRYRGTEKIPDQHLVALYSREISAAKRGRGEEPEEVKTPKGGGKPKTEEVGAKISGTRVHAGAVSDTTPAVMQMAATESAAAGRAPTWAERANGRRVIQDQLRFNVPSGELYNLQAESGNLPPSEGVMLNKDGQIVSQAVGYGDDHYLPFNLKNLKALKGGEYIRTRSVGGLTSEDIYTGLISGARRVTVVSRSGTFSVEFAPDFRGGRRYNDKALRMTRRYEQILDAVQSNKVSSGPVPPAVEQAIRREVAEEYPGESRTATRKMVTERIREYREDPDFGPEDEKILNLVYEQGLKDNPNRDANEWLKSARNQVLAGKRFNYQLDAAGYEAGQNALQEQFPYYIKSIPVTEKEGELISREKDKGYVEPGRNRPTKVKAGLFGTEENQPEGKKVGSMKFSASQADYQRGRIGEGPHDLQPRQMRRPTPEPEPAAAGAAGAAGAAAGAAGARPGEPAGRDQARAQLEAGDRAVDLFSEMQRVGIAPGVRTRYTDVADLDIAQFSAAMEEPEQRARFDQMVDEVAGELSRDPDRRLVDAWNHYRRARGDLNAVNFDPRMALRWTPEPMQFEGRGYQPNDTDEDRDIAIRTIDNRTRSVTTGLSLSELAGRGEPALQNELNALRQVHQEIRLDPTIQQEGNLEARRRVARRIFGDQYDRSAIDVIVGGGNQDLIDRMTDVHRMRTLKTHYQGTWPAALQPTRNPEQNQVGQAVNQVTAQSQVRSRLSALNRYRTGLGFEERSNADDQIQMAQEMMGRIEAGESIDQTEVDTMLAETEEAFRNAPGSEVHLHQAHRALRRTQPEAFTQDPEGYWRFNPSRNRSQ